MTDYISAPTRRILLGVAVACLGLAIPAMATTTPGGTSRRSPGTCRAGQLRVWLGLGTSTVAVRAARRPLEFTNVGPGSCYLDGFPLVTVTGPAGVPLGPAAGHAGHAARVRLGQGATGHAVVSIGDPAAVGGCRPRTGVLRVSAPGTAAASVIGDLAVRTCAGRVSLRVSAIRPGTGVPGQPAR